MDDQSLKNVCETMQSRWADDLCQLGKEQEREMLQRRAQLFVRSHYCYDEPGVTVLFKPTLASSIPQRNHAQGAISYFIGGDDFFPEDQGFALMGWRELSFVNQEWSLLSDVVLVAGQLHLYKRSGHCVIADYTMGYMCCQDGQWRLMLHHSSVNDF